MAINIPDRVSRPMNVSAEEPSGLLAYAGPGVWCGIMVDLWVTPDVRTRASNPIEVAASHGSHWSLMGTDRRRAGHLERTSALSLSIHMENRPVPSRSYQ